MNERIREIAREADIDWHRHWNDDGSNRLEHFAELIVRKCAEACRRVGELEQEAAIGQMYADAVLEHFGVEE